VGIEHIDDILADLGQALDAAAKAAPKDEADASIPDPQPEHAQPLEV